MGETSVAWEIYEAHSDALAAMRAFLRTEIFELPKEFLEYLGLELWGTTISVRYSLDYWNRDHSMLADSFESMVARFDCKNVILDCSGQQSISTPAYSAIYRLYWTVARKQGRFALCCLTPDLLAFVQWHDRQMLQP